MKLPKELTTVTPFSRKLALLLFILLPIIAFILGEKYQATIDSTMTTNPSLQLTTPIDEKTVNWKTYTSPNKIYTFKYPSDFVVTPTVYNGIISDSVDSYFGPHSPPHPQYTINEFLVMPKDFHSVDEWIKGQPPLEDPEKFILNGDAAVRGNYFKYGTGRGSTTIVFVMHNGIGYEIIIVYDKLPLQLEKKSDLPPPNPDIFSTFKFLK